MTPVVRTLLKIYDARIKRARKGALPSARSEISYRSGVCRTVVHNWKTKKTGGRVDTVEAVANTLGYRLVLQNINTGEIVAND